jgi:hypothetical protein
LEFHVHYDIRFRKSEMLFVMHILLLLFNIFWSNSNCVLVRNEALDTEETVTPQDLESHPSFGCPCSPQCSLSISKKPLLSAFLLVGASIDSAHFHSQPKRALLATALTPLQSSVFAWPIGGLKCATGFSTSSLTDPNHALASLNLNSRPWATCTWWQAAAQRPRRGTAATRCS